MPGHRHDPFLREVYEVIKDIPGVLSIDGRSSRIAYAATVIRLAAIVESLTEAYGAPTEDHPLINHITWHLPRERHIVALKAQDIVARGEVYHYINAWSY